VSVQSNNALAIAQDLECHPAIARVFALTESLGSVESMLEPPAVMTHASVAGTLQGCYGNRLPGLKFAIRFGNRNSKCKEKRLRLE